MSESGLGGRPRMAPLAVLGVALSIAIGGFVLPALGSHRANQPPNPRPRPPVAFSPAPPEPSPPIAPPVFTTQPPPPGLPVVWLQRPWEQVEGSLRLHAFDWDGREVGRLSVACEGQCQAQQSPDGARLLIAQLHQIAMVEATGRPVGAIAIDAAAMWSDDSRHICLLQPQPATTPDPVGVERAELAFADSLHGPPRPVAALEGMAWSTGGWVLDACSVATNRAVVTLQNDSVISAVRVVEISTGRSLYSGDDPQPTPGPVCGACHLIPPLAVTHDARFAAENLANGTTRFRDLTTGTAEPWTHHQVQGGEALAISWNRSVILTTDGVVDTITQRTIWHAPTTVLAGVAPPGSDAFLVVLAGGPGLDSQERLVRPDGSSVTLLSGQSNG